MLARFSLAIILATLACSPLFAQEELRALFDKAQMMEDMTAEGIPGFVLTADVQIFPKKDAAITGKYLFIRSADGKWKQEIAFPGYKRVRIGNGRIFWQVRNTSGESPQIYELGQLVAVKRVAKVTAEDKLKRVRPEKEAGIEATCVQKTSSHSSQNTSCFDSNSGDLVRSVSGGDSSPISWRVQRIEYSQYEKWQGKSYPRTIRGFNGKRLLVEVKFDQIKLLAEPSTDLFAKPKDAAAWLDCDESVAWRAKSKLQPIYPPEVRRRGGEGAVSLYVVIEEDGHLSNISIANSAGKELDDAAASAVAQWTYERSDACPDSKGRAEALVDVFFTIQRP
jgi:TonB family protein